MSGFFRGPPLVIHGLIICVVLAFIIPAASGVIGSAQIGGLAGVVIGIVYWVTALIWGVGQGRRREFIVIVLVVAVLAAMVISMVIGPEQRAYLMRVQESLIRDGDVIVYATVSRDRGAVRYRLKEVWRNRGKGGLPWADGEELPELTELYNGAYAEYDKIVFFSRSTGTLRRLGSFNVEGGELSLKLDIGLRNSLQRLLDWHVPVMAFRRYVVENEPGLLRN